MKKLRDNERITREDGNRYGRWKINLTVILFYVAEAERNDIT